MVGLTLESPDMPTLEMDANNRQSVEFQKYITDLDYLSLNFKESLCGWIPKMNKREMEVLGEEQTFYEGNYDIDKVNRFINEKGANMMAKQLDGLIGQVTQTSNLDPMFIWRIWDGWADELASSLITSYYVDGNPYELRIDHLGTILAKAYSYYGITFKAVGGFYTKQNMNTIISMWNQQMRGGMENNMPKRGLRERLGIGGSGTPQ